MSDIVEVNGEFAGTIHDFDQAWVASDRDGEALGEYGNREDARRAVVQSYWRGLGNGNAAV